MFHVKQAACAAFAGLLAMVLCRTLRINAAVCMIISFSLINAIDVENDNIFPILATIVHFRGFAVIRIGKIQNQTHDLLRFVAAFVPPMSNYIRCKFSRVIDNLNQNQESYRQCLKRRKAA
jgi:hypothetical protein